MEKQKRNIPLVAKVIGGIAFLSVFILNVVLFVQKDSSTTSGLSIETLEASAQPGGEDDSDVWYCYDDSYSFYTFDNPSCYLGTYTVVKDFDCHESAGGQYNGDYTCYSESDYSVCTNEWIGGDYYECPDPEEYP